MQIIALHFFYSQKIIALLISFECFIKVYKDFTRQKCRIKPVIEINHMQNISRSSIVGLYKHFKFIQPLDWWAFSGNFGSGWEDIQLIESLSFRQSFSLVCYVMMKAFYLKQFIHNLVAHKHFCNCFGLWFFHFSRPLFFSVSSLLFMFVNV